MILFVLFSSALVLLALAFLLPPLLRPAPQIPPAMQDAQIANLAILREQLVQLDGEHAASQISEAQWSAARAEIVRRVLEESQAIETPVRHTRARPTAWALAAGVPVIALVMYASLGNVQGLEAAPAQVSLDAPSPENGGGPSMAQVEAMVTQMSERLYNMPPGEAADPGAWDMLARTLAALQRHPEAARAYERATDLAPNNAQLLADRADLLVMLQNRQSAGEPQQLIDRALKADPNNVKALALAGSAAFEREAFADAVTYWQRARTLATPGSEFAAGLDRSLEAARTSAAVPGKTAPFAEAVPRVQAAQVPQVQVPQTVSVAAAGAGTASLSGVVSLAPSLKSKVAPGDTLFIFARAAEGPRIPLAVLRVSAATLPATFTLNDQMAMSPEFTLSRFDKVMLEARVSRSGEAMAKSGDLIGRLGPLGNRGSMLNLTIDQVQP
jgi:cytochrome c-type biogenesis protein CcmH